MRFLVYGLKKQQRSKVFFLITKMHTNLYLLSTRYDIQVSLINNNNDKKDDNNNISMHK